MLSISVKDILMWCWSTGQSYWLQIQRSGFGSRRYQILWEVVGLERGPGSLVSTVEELLGRKSSGCGLERQEYGRRDPSRWLRGSAKVGTAWSRRSSSKFEGRAGFLFRFHPSETSMSIKLYLPDLSNCCSSGTSDNPLRSLTSVLWWVGARTWLLGTSQTGYLVSARLPTALDALYDYCMDEISCVRASAPCPWRAVWLPYRVKPFPSDMSFSWGTTLQTGWSWFQISMRSLNSF
jgi:hypothetical protein